MNNIKEELMQLADEEYKKFHSELCPNTNNIIGVRIPILRKMAKEIAKQNSIQFLENIDTTYYETVMLYGLVIGYMKATIEEKLQYLDVFVPRIDNWAVCDCCCSTYKFTSQHLEQMWEYLQKYLISTNEFEVRFAVIMMMDYYLNDAYMDKVLEKLKEVKQDGYYVKMGIAWLLSEVFIKNEEKARKFLAENTLDKFTYNKTLQKIIESNRVNAEIKDQLRKMKKKTS